MATNAPGATQITIQSERSETVVVLPLTTDVNKGDVNPKGKVVKVTQIPPSHPIR